MEENYPIIDMHCHILPGVDDGARTMEESMKLLEMAYRQGISSAVATPHYYPGHGDGGDAGKQEELRLALAGKVKEAFPGFQIYPGHELYYHEGLADSLSAKKARTLADSPYVLVEFSTSASYGTIFRGVRSLAGVGYVPVVAHVERYRCLREGKNLQELLGCGCRLQMNFDSLQGNRFSPDTRWCRKQALEGRIFALGTDMHRLDFRPPDIRQALAWLEGYVEPSLRRQMLYENPASVIEYRK